MPLIDFFVSMKPVGKGRPRMSLKTRHVYTPQTTIDAEETIANAARKAMRETQTLIIPSNCPVEIALTAHLPLAKSASKKERERADKGLLPCLKKPDVDNIAKLCLDAINGIVYEDDKQVTKLIVNKLWNTKTIGVYFLIKWGETNNP